MVVLWYKPDWFPQVTGLRRMAGWPLVDKSRRMLFGSTAGRACPSLCHSIRCSAIQNSLRESMLSLSWSDRFQTCFKTSGKHKTWHAKNDQRIS